MIRPAAVAALLAFSLAGCATPRPEPEIRTVEVKVAVPVPCEAHVAAAPSYADAGAEFVDDIFEQVRLLLLGRNERQAREKVLEGAIVGCGGSVK